VSDKRPILIEIIGEIKMTANNYPTNNNHAQAIVYYDGNSQFLLELKDDVEQTLSLSLPTQLKRVVGGASPIFPILEIILASTSATIMTSILSKFGEDIYNHMKNKIHKIPQKDGSPLILIVKVFTDKVAVDGHVTLKDHQTMIDATKAIQQMLNDAQNTEVGQILQGIPAHPQHGSEFIPIVKSGLLFDYEYDTENKKWTLRNIRKMKDL